MSPDPAVKKESSQGGGPDTTPPPPAPQPPARGPEPDTGPHTGPRPAPRAEVIRRLVRTGSTAQLEDLLESLPTPEVAELFPHLDALSVRTVVDILFSERRAARTLRELPTPALDEVLADLPDDRVAAVLARLAPDDAAEFVTALSEERRDRLREMIPWDLRAEVERVLRYPEGTSGAVMTTRFLALDVHSSAQQAIEAIRGSGDVVEAVFYLYVRGDQGRLVGVVPIRRLVSAAPDQKLEAIMIRDPVRVRGSEDRENAAQLVQQYNLLAVPVVDEAGRLIGVITVDDIIDVIRDEATEDMYRLQGLSEDDRVFSPLRRSVGKRLPWMVLNLATAFLAASVVGFFESSIEKVVALAVFMPVVAGMGGNGGTQTLTVITRGIALGEFQNAPIWRVILKQAVVGLAVGAVTGLLTAFAAYLWKGNPWLGLVLFLAMVANLVVAGFAGAAIPALLRALKQDPAMGGGVIVTTFTDVCGFFSFLGLATIFLRYLA